MKDLTIIGIDIAKNFMQIHGTDSKPPAVQIDCFGKILA